MNDASVYKKQSCENASSFKEFNQSSGYNQHQIPALGEINTGRLHVSDIFRTARDEMVRYYTSK
jgi:hypothetical protein